MSADDLIRDPATIRASDEPDRDDRYWAAITRDRSVGSVDAVTRLADSEQAASRQIIATLTADVHRLAAAAMGWKRLYDAAITATVDTMHANTRAERAERAIEQAEGRVNALLTERDELRASVTEYEGSLQAAQSRLARVASMAEALEAMASLPIEEREDGLTATMKAAGAMAADLRSVLEVAS